MAEQFINEIKVWPTFKHFITSVKFIHIFTKAKAIEMGLK